MTVWANMTFFKQLFKTALNVLFKLIIPINQNDAWRLPAGEKPGIKIELLRSSQ